MNLVSMPALIGLSLYGGTEIPPRVPDKVPAVFTPSPSTAVSVQGYVGNRVHLHLERRLLPANLDLLLTPFTEESANPPGTETAPHYLKAAAEAWAYTGDPRLKTLLDETTHRLLHSRWMSLEPWLQNRVIDALVTHYRYTGSSSSLEAATRALDELTGAYGEGPGQRAFPPGLSGSLSSATLVEAAASLYRYTGQLRYLQFGRYLMRSWDRPEAPHIARTLLETGSVKAIRLPRADAVLSALNGLAELYQATGDVAFLRPVELAWRDITEKRLYANGAPGWGNQFSDDHVLRADARDVAAGPGQANGTLGWLRLNWTLFRLTGEVKYGDALERTIYNTVLAAQGPEGRLSPVVPLSGRKRFEQGDSASTAALLEAIALLPRMAWGRRGDAVAVNLYFAGAAQTPLVPGFHPLSVNVQVETRYPLDGAITIRVAPSLPARFPVELRVPSWCGRFSAAIGGETYRGRPGQFLRIDREWKDAATIEVRMDLPPRLIDAGPSYPGYVGVMRGPLLLAMDDALSGLENAWLAGLNVDPDRRIALTPLQASVPAWTMDGYVGNERLPKRPVKLALTPLAEAGSSGGEYRVWLPGTFQ